MSHSLFLHFEPRPRRAEFLAHCARRKHYKAAGDRLAYANDDTGVFFQITLRCGWDFLLRRTVKSAEFEVNYNRPSFFGLEAEKELSAIIGVFHPRIDDPQMEGMGDGPYSSEGFLRGWNFGNAFAIGQIAAPGAGREVATMPAADLRAAWEWNHRCAERRERLNLRSYVPTILFWRIDGRACRIAIWGGSMPILLPRVDYVIVAKDIGKTEIGLVPWAAVIDMAQRAGFDAGKEPLALRYLTPPPAIVDWAANLPLVDLKAYERLAAHQVLDKELVGGAS